MSTNFHVHNRQPSTVVLNLFRAVAHFHKNFDVMITMSLGLASDIMAIE